MRIFHQEKSAVSCVNGKRSNNIAYTYGVIRCSAVGLSFLA